MAQSVKLSDGSYIDTEGIYDVTQGKTQKDVNAQFGGCRFYKDSTNSATFTFTIKGASHFVFFTRYGVYSVFNDSTPLVVLCSSSSSDRTFTIDWNGDTVTITGNKIIYRGIFVIY